MNELSVSASNPQQLHQHVDGEETLLEELRAIWIPHRHRDLEVRYQLGVLLNQRLGSPTVRQSYGQATIQRVSKELDLDKSDISRMRRFAHQFKTFEAFQQSEPTATSWHKVRELVTKEKCSIRDADSRALWGVLRSLKASIKALSRDCPFKGPKAKDLRLALHELYRLAHARLGFEFVWNAWSRSKSGCVICHGVCRSEYAKECGFYCFQSHDLTEWFLASPRHSLLLSCKSRQPQAEAIA